MNIEDKKKNIIFRYKVAQALMQLERKVYGNNQEGSFITELFAESSADIEDLFHECFANRISTKTIEDARNKAQPV